MTEQHDMNQQIEQLIAWYSDGSGGASPTVDQWKNILAQPIDKPITLINFFKLNNQAQYAADSSEHRAAMSGNEAFERYAAVSIPTMERVGGSFLHVGPFAGVFLGPEADWDIVAIGSYPNTDALLALFSDANYRNAYVHRTAACDRQAVLIASN